MVSWNSICEFVTKKIKEDHILSEHAIVLDDMKVKCKVVELCIKKFQICIIMEWFTEELLSTHVMHVGKSLQERKFTSGVV